MKRYQKANTVMTGAAVLFMAALAYKTIQPSSEAKLIYFMAQSLLIGCLADWFAVNAIFRNPIPLFHFRPLVAAYQHQIASGLQKFFDTVLMREEDVEKSLASFSVVQFIKNHGPVREKILRSLIRQIAAFIWNEWDQKKDTISEFVSRKLQDSSDEWTRLLLKKGTSPQISRLLYEFFLEAILSYAKTDDFVILIQKAIEEKAAGESQSFAKGILLRVMSMTGAFNADDMARSIQSALVKGLTSILDPSSKEGALLFEEWNKGLSALSQNEEVREVLQGYIEKASDAAVKDGKLISAISRWEIEWKENKNTRLRWENKALQAGDSLSQKIMDNPEFGKQIDQYVRSAVFHIFTIEKEPILQSLRQLLDHFHSKDFSEIIEERVWPWLEDIRLNGAVVGLLAGAVFYLFIFFIYVPFVHAL